MYPFRFFLAVDVEASTLTEAYKKLHKQLSEANPEEIEWASTGEAYDENGDQISIEKLNEVIVAIRYEKNKEF